MERLSQREIQLSARLREVESNLEAYPRSEIRDAYRAVHEATLRLFMLRNQMEQLEERRQSLSLYQERLRELLVLAESQLKAVTERERGGDRRTRLLGGTGQLASPLDLLAAAERERMLIRRTLEHELVQLMGAVALQVEICLQVERKRADDLRPELLRLRELTSEAVHGLRRTLLELAPSLLEEIGLVETLRRYLRELARISQLERVAVTGPEQDARLVPPLSHLVYRLLQELAVRAARQPGVTNLAVELRVESAQLVVQRRSIPCRRSIRWSRNGWSSWVPVWPRKDRRGALARDAPRAPYLSPDFVSRAGQNVLPRSGRTEVPHSS